MDILKRDDHALVGGNIDACNTSQDPISIWAALRESFAAEDLSRVRWRPALAGYLAKPALGQQNGPGNFVSGRKKACLADHARGVNWPFLARRPAGGFAMPCAKRTCQGSHRSAPPGRRTRDRFSLGSRSAIDPSPVAAAIVEKRVV